MDPVEYVWAHGGCHEAAGNVLLKAYAWAELWRAIMGWHRGANNVLPVATAAVTIGVAFALDHWVEMSTIAAAQTFNAAPVLWIQITANLIVAGCLLALTWLVVARGGWYRRWVAASLLLVGGALVLSPTLAMQAPGLARLGLTHFLAASPASRQGYVSAFVALLGLGGLWLRR